jgi:uncharacterized protein YwgA
MEVGRAIEWYIIVLLGVFDRPIPTALHLQKEIFVLSKAVPKISEYVVYEKHHEGPYSEDLSDVANDPVYHPSSYRRELNVGYVITQEGKQVYKKILEANKDRQDFIELLAMAKMVRDIYDVLSRDELLLLIYSTYPEYTEYSSVSSRILEPQKKRQLASSLLKKGIITEERYQEIVG